MIAGKARFLVVAVAIAACSDDLRGPPARDLVAAADRAVSTFESRADTQALLDRASDAAWSLDARALYEAIPEGGAAGPTRAVSFEISGEKGKRSIRHRSAPDGGSTIDLFDPARDSRSDAEPELGRYSLLLASRPLDSGNYRLRVRSALDAGRGDLMTVWRAVPEMLRYFERGAPADELRRRFRETSEFAARYLEIGVSTRPETPDGTAVEITLRADRANVAADFPHLVRYVERLSRRVQTSGALETAQGEALARWGFRGAAGGVHIDFVASDGRLRAEKGGLVDLASPQRLRLVQASTAEVLGVKTTIAGMRSDTVTDPDAVSPRISFRAHEQPAVVRVEGALFGVVPVAAIDAVLPGTLEGSVRGILATLLDGREGRGVDVLIRSRSESPTAHEISSTFVADVPATRFTRRALRLAAALIQADASERADMLRFARALAACLAADLPSV